MKMVRQLSILLLTLVSTPLMLSAQPRVAAAREADREQFRWVTGQKETIPNWVFEPQGNGRYVGISDPCLDTLKSENQALLRAWFLSVMDDGLEVNIVQEQYEKISRVASYDSTSNRYTQFMRLYVQPFGQSHFRQGRSYTTIFGEHIVEIFEISAKERDDNTITFTQGGGGGCPLGGEYVMSGSEHSVVKSNIHIEIDMAGLCNGDYCSSKFLLSGTRERYGVENKYNGDDVPNRNRGRYWYENGGKGGDTESLMHNRFSLMDGLWCAMLESVLYSIVNCPNYEYTIRSATQLDDMGADYQLTRLAYKGSLSACTQGFKVEENALESEWSLSLGGR